MDSTAFWQDFSDGDAPEPPYADAFPARLPGGLRLDLPIRPMPGTDNGIASLIINQASFAVQRELARLLAEQLAPAGPDFDRSMWGDKQRRPRE